MAWNDKFSFHESQLLKLNRISASNYNTVTRTLKGNEKQFELARIRVNGFDCKTQFAILKIDRY